jgi:hypothetical protein
MATITSGRVDAVPDHQGIQARLGVAYTKGTGNYFKTSGSPKQQNAAAVGRGVGTLSYSYTF